LDNSRTVEASDKAARLRVRGSAIVNFANEKAPHLAQLKEEYDHLRHHLCHPAEQLFLVTSESTAGHGLPLRLCGGTTGVPEIANDLLHRTESAGLGH
jgi:hypothetical protein